MTFIDFIWITKSRSSQNNSNFKNKIGHLEHRLNPMSFHKLNSTKKMVKLLKRNWNARGLKPEALKDNCLQQLFVIEIHNLYWHCIEKGGSSRYVQQYAIAGTLLLLLLRNLFTINLPTYIEHSIYRPLYLHWIYIHLCKCVKYDVASFIWINCEVRNGFLFLLGHQARSWPHFHWTKIH